MYRKIRRKEYPRKKYFTNYSVFSQFCSVLNVIKRKCSYPFGYCKVLFQMYFKSVRRYLIKLLILFKLRLSTYKYNYFFEQFLIALIGIPSILSFMSYYGISYRLILPVGSDTEFLVFYCFGMTFFFLPLLIFIFSFLLSFFTPYRWYWNSTSDKTGYWYFIKVPDYKKKFSLRGFRNGG